MRTKENRTLLAVNTSARAEQSVTRQLVAHVLEQLQAQYPNSNVIERDLAHGLPPIDAHWVSANFTKPEQRSVKQQARLALSDALIDEIETADTLVIGAPMYNFSVPASLKLWIDLIARVGRTFRYTENGPQGLLRNKQAYVVVATGGVRINSDVDFASGYLNHILGFIGIDDVTLISAERIDRDNPDALPAVQQQINTVLESRVANRHPVA